MGVKKKGVYFTMDAFFATILLLIGIILITKFSFTEVSTEQIDFLSKDVLSSFGELKISEINNSWVQQQINDSYIINTDNSLLEQIGIFWATNQTGKAQNLSRILVEDLIPKQYGVGIFIENQEVYLRNKSTTPINIVSSRRMLTGIQQDSPVAGSSATALLRKIRNKRTAVFFYFGGFIGQGNITAMMTELPKNVNGSSITEILMEGDVVSDFDFYINDNLCGKYNVSAPSMVADAWDMTSCKDNILANINNTFKIVFYSNISNSYVAGGYIKVSYNSTIFNEESDNGTSRQYFSGIDGVVNIFNSFYVPGNMSNMTIYLHYKANPSVVNNTFYLTVGDSVIFRDNTSTTEKMITLDNSNLTLLNYSDMSLNTVPVRIGFENLSFKEVIIGTGEGFGDIILTTDVSGSMDWRFDQDSVSGTVRLCNDSQLYNDSTQRLSVAKCLDKDFIIDIFENTTLNRVALISYDSSVDSTLALTNNENDLYTEIDSYNDGDYTCVSCGVAESHNLLLNPPPVQLNNDYWRFSLDYQSLNPPNNWMLNSYNDSSWEIGEASFGYRSSEKTAIMSLNTTAEMSENNGDDADNYIDFNSGTLNSTNNTFRNLTLFDGWDWIEGNVYNGDNTNVNIMGLTDRGGGDYELTLDIGGSSSGWSTYETSAGAFGVLVNITPTMYNVISSGGYASFSFRWSWDDQDWYETTDQVWIKASITNTTGDRIYLGSDLDSGHSNGDADLDVYADDDPDGDRWNQLFSQEITQYITEPGIYYFDFGGKLHRNMNSEDGMFYFDDIQVGFLSSVGNTYYRTTFELDELSRFSDPKLFVASDDGAEVYLNGNLLVNDSGPHAYSYWNVDNLSIGMGNLIEGTNVLAVKLFNNDSVSGFFDLQLIANMTQRQKAVVIMSDGDANRCAGSWTTSDSGCDNCGGSPCCPDSSGSFSAACPDIAGIGDASDQLVNISCHLHNIDSVSVFAVAFGNVSDAGKQALNLSASCDNSTHFFTSENVSGLSDMYRNIAQSIMEGFTTRKTQIILSSGSTFAESVLYDDSYIEMDYEPIVTPPKANEISVVIHENGLDLNQTTNNCTTSIVIPPGLRVLDSQVTIYSADHWANMVSVDDIVVFNLSEYSDDYITLGDPFAIQIPANLLTMGAHNLSLQTGNDDQNYTGCSENNSLIYKATVNSTTPRTNVVEFSDGCVWSLEFEDGTNSNFSTPLNYNGSNTCSYTNSSISYDPDDSYQIGVYELLKQLDFDGDGRIIFNFGLEDLEIIVSVVDNIPYLWGPSIFEVRMWQ